MNPYLDSLKNRAIFKIHIILEFKPENSNQIRSNCQPNTKQRENTYKSSRERSQNIRKILLSLFFLTLANH